MADDADREKAKHGGLPDTDVNQAAHRAVLEATCQVPRSRPPARERFVFTIGPRDDEQG